MVTVTVVDRLQVEEHPGLEVVQHLQIGLVQMRLVCVVSAHYESLSCRSGLTHIGPIIGAYAYTGQVGHFSVRLDAGGLWPSPGVREMSVRVLRSSWR